MREERTRNLGKKEGWPKTCGWSRFPSRRGFAVHQAIGYLCYAAMFVLFVNQNNSVAGTAESYRVRVYTTSLFKYSGKIVCP